MKITKREILPIRPATTPAISVLAMFMPKIGSFDLTPLFVGSQGTLVFLVVLKADFYSVDETCGYCC